MELSQFTKLLTHDIKSAKIFFKYLLHTHQFANKNEGEKAILAYFSSLPEEYKLVEHFSKDFNTFFLVYGIKQATFELYEKYVQDKHIQQLMQNKNPDYPWPQKNIEFSLSEYIKTVSILGNNKTQEERKKVSLDFIEKTKNQLENFINTNKVETIHQLAQLHVLDELIIHYYQEAKNFCNNYHIELLDIVKESNCIPQNGFNFLLDKFLTHNNEENIREFLNEVVLKKDTLFENDFFIEYEKEIHDTTRSDKHVINTFISLIASNNYEYAYIILEYFEKEIKDVLQLLYKDTNIDEKNIKKVILFITEYDVSEDGDYEKSIRQFVNYYNTRKSHDELEKELNNNNKTNSRIKI